MRHVREDAPPFLFEIAAATDFKTIERSGVAMSHAILLKVTGAGSLEVKLKIPRGGAATETLTMVDGEAIPGQFVGVVAADSGCYPIKVWGV